MRKIKGLQKAEPSESRQLSVRESAEARAGRILTEELGKLGLSLEQVRLQAGCSEAKLRVARGLRQQTTMSLRWIAEQLGMGSWKYLSNVLAGERQEPEQPRLGL